MRGCVQAVLGVFQKLVASKAHDHEGFRLLGAVTTHVPLPALSPFLPTVRAPVELCSVSVDGLPAAGIVAAHAAARAVALPSHCMRPTLCACAR